MFVRSYKRKKNGKWHEYFSVVENRRVADGTTVQRTVLYLGEITTTQQDTWRKTLEVFDDRMRRKDLVERQGRGMYAISGFLREIQSKPVGQWKRRYDI